MLRSFSLVAFVLIWSTGFIVARLAAPHADLQLYLLGRFFLTACVMGGAAAVSSSPWPRGKGFLGHLAAGVLMQGVYLCASYWSIAHGMTAGIMSLLGALQPLFTALFLVVSGRENLGRQTWLGLLLGFSGVSCVLVPKIAATGAGSLTVLSVLAALLSVMAITGGALLQKWVPYSDLRPSAAVQNLGGLLVAGLMVLTFGGTHWDNSAVLWGALTWAVLVASAIGTTLLMWMMRHGDATKVTALLLLVPPLAALQGYLFFGERLNSIQLCGFALALAGVLLARSARTGGS